MNEAARNKTNRGVHIAVESAASHGAFGLNAQLMCDTDDINLSRATTVGKLCATLYIVPGFLWPTRRQFGPGLGRPRRIGRSVGPVRWDLAGPKIPTSVVLTGLSHFHFFRHFGNLCSYVISYLGWPSRSYLQSGRRVV